jgi:hypothetical protein
MSTEHTGSDDPLIRETEEKGRSEGGGRAMTAANLFDLRRIIGGLFVGYGVLLTILGLTDSDAEIQRAAGININLWAGLGMLVFGGLMLLWAFTRPLGDQLREAEPDEPPSDDPSRAAPRGVDAAALASHQRRRGTRGDRDRPRGGGDTGT